MKSRLVSLRERASEQTSITALENLLSRALSRAKTYAVLLADWPALVEYAEREADEIDDRLRKLRGWN